MTNLDLEQLQRQGFTVIPDFLDRQTTRKIRDHIDSLVPAFNAADQDRKRWISTLRHPIPGAIMAELINHPPVRVLATQLLHSRELRLLEQVLIRSDPKPPPHEPTGWHVDWTFFPRHYEARPRQTYFHMVHALNTVPPGGAAFMIVPGSHHLTYAASAKMNTAAELAALKSDPAGVAGVDINKGIEICPAEGDLLIFNPMALHSASGNATDQPRYVYFTSYFDTSATEFWDAQRENKYRDNFTDELRDQLPEELRVLLEW